ncbi:GATA-type zinc finger protein 1 [Lepisosteus oculatus]|uniref:GATA-type zinc finger protein 1 n=1 Tax=Lepisosteus oculatus TaxID=7918 RepID=UPI0035F52754
MDSLEGDPFFPDEPPDFSLLKDLLFPSYLDTERCEGGGSALEDCNNNRLLLRKSPRNRIEDAVIEPNTELHSQKPSLEPRRAKDSDNFSQVRANRGPVAQSPIVTHIRKPACQGWRSELDHVFNSSVSLPVEHSAPKSTDSVIISSNAHSPSALNYSPTEEKKSQDQVPQTTILYLLHETTKLILPARQDLQEGSSVDGNSLHSLNQSDLGKDSLRSSPLVLSKPTGAGRKDTNMELNKYSGSFRFMSNLPESSALDLINLISIQCKKLLHPENADDTFGTASKPEGTGCLVDTFAGKEEGGSKFKEAKTMEGSPRQRTEVQGETKAEALRRGGEDEGARTAKAGSSKALPSAECRGRAWQLRSPHQNKVPAAVGYISPCCNARASLLGEKEAGRKPWDSSCYEERASSTIKEGALWKKRQMLDPIDPNGAENMVGPSDEQERLPVLTTSQRSMGIISLVVNQQNNTELPESDLMPIKRETPPSDNMVSLPASLDNGYGDTAAESGVTMNSNDNLTSKSGVTEALQVSGKSKVSSGTLCNTIYVSVRQAKSPRLAADWAESALHSISQTPACGTGEQLSEKESSPPPDPRSCGRAPRKQQNPTRSAARYDPNFRGVTMHMEMQLNDRRADQCQLVITPHYSTEFWKISRKLRSRKTRPLTDTRRISSSEEESDSASSLKNKICASCDTRKTPLWRDAEDGTPLCNACGIRYKKYRIRCFHCWHIPKKEGNSNSRCFRCGNALRVAAYRKNSSW